MWSDLQKEMAKSIAEGEVRNIQDLFRTYKLQDSDGSASEIAALHLAAFASAAETLRHHGLVVVFHVDRSPTRFNNSHDRYEQASALSRALAGMEVVPLPKLIEFIAHDFKTEKEIERNTDEERQNSLARRSFWMAWAAIIATVVVQMGTAAFITGSIDIQSVHDPVRVSPITLPKADTIRLRDTVILHDTIQLRSASTKDRRAFIYRNR